MDPITTAIVAAITAGVTETGKKAILDAYQSLKRLILSKYGRNNKISKAIDELEETSESRGRQMVLAENVAIEKVGQESDILGAAEKLMELLKQTPGGEQHIMNAQGKFIAQADRGSNASININKGICNE